MQRRMSVESQQTKITIKERDRAEEQTIIANRERNQANIEKGLAEKAQIAAIASAAEAEKARNIAEEQTKVATKHMVIAQKARAHADTLLYLSLANSLAQSSLAQSERGNTDLSRLLALVSWHYCHENGENAIGMQNVFNALVRSSDSFQKVENSLKGDIYRLRCKDGVVTAVTDYGEILSVKDGISCSHILGKYDFRDFIDLPQCRKLVLCSDGRLLIVNAEYNKTVASAMDIPVTLVADLTATQLLNTGKQSKQKSSEAQNSKNWNGADVWHHLIYTNDSSTIIAQSDHNIAWLNAKNYSVIAIVTLDNNITCFGLQDDRLHVFAKGAQHYISTTPGGLVRMNLTLVGKLSPITAYEYDKSRQWHIVGMNNGTIFIINKDGQLMKKLMGHNAAITELKLGKKLLASASYDNTLRLWDIEDINALITSNPVNMEHWPLSFDTTEDKTHIWIGTAEGDVFNFCDYAKQNAMLTMNLLQREFTDAEWNYYVGKGVKKLNFMK